MSDEGTEIICGAVDPATVTIITSINPDYLETPFGQAWCRCTLKPNHERDAHVCEGWQGLGKLENHPSHAWPVRFII